MANTQNCNLKINIVKIDSIDKLFSPSLSPSAQWKIFNNVIAKQKSAYFWQQDIVILEDDLGRFKIYKSRVKRIKVNKIFQNKSKLETYLFTELL